MKKINLLLIIFGIICTMPVIGIADVGPNWIEQYGIRWTFDKNISSDGSGDTYRYGQFVNGDYWVIGPVAITNIDPVCIITDTPMEDGNTFSGRFINGSMINPIPGGPQGYDSGASGWTESLNVAYGISPAEPLVVDVDDYPVKSLVSAVSTEVVPSKHSSPRLQAASILTVVKQAPSADAFRPPYCGNEKFEEISKIHINWEALKNLPAVNGTPDISISEKAFERPWIEHGANYPGSVINPVDNMPSYGREQARASNIAALLLNLDYPNSQKETLLIRFLQYGIDVSGIIACPEARKIWTGNGGITNGKKLAGVFAAKVFDNGLMKAQHAKSGKYLYEVAGYGPGNPPPDYIHFGNEDDQVFYVSQTDVDATNSDRWSPDSRDAEKYPYTQDDIGLPEWGIRHAANPYISNKWWDTGYRGVSGCNMPGSALVGHIMGMKDIWNNPAFFDYADRYISVISTFDTDKPWRVGTNGIDWYVSARFVWNIWEAYRVDYSPVWSGNPLPEYSDTDLLPSDQYLGRPFLEVLNNILKKQVGHAVIKITVPEAGNITLTIVNSKGKEIITLWDGHKEAGVHNLPWDGKDSGGKKVGSGVYMVHMRAGSYKDTKKIAVIK